MSFRRLLDREVSIVTRVVSGTDARGNDVITEGATVTGVRCGRDLEEADEERDGADLQRSRYVYFFLPDVELSGYDVIVDAGHRFEVNGPPELVVRRRGGRPHHVEAVAYWTGPQT